VGAPIFDRGATQFELSDSIWTVPNFITLIRLALIPVFVWLVLGADERLAAAILLGVLGATDWIDGYLARRLNQHSAFGKVLDPITDRLMFVVAIVTMIIDGSVPRWFAFAVLFREIVVSLAALGIGALGVRSIDVTWWGKVATFGLMFTFPFFLGSYSDVSSTLTDTWRVVAWAIGIPSLVLSYLAGFGYIPIAREALAQSRASS